MRRLRTLVVLAAWYGAGMHYVEGRALDEVELDRHLRDGGRVIARTGEDGQGFYHEAVRVDDREPLPWDRLPSPLAAWLRAAPGRRAVIESTPQGLLYRKTVAWDSAGDPAPNVPSPAEEA